MSNFESALVRLYSTSAWMLTTSPTHSGFTGEGESDTILTSSWLSAPSLAAVPPDSEPDDDAAVALPAPSLSFESSLRSERETSGEASSKGGRGESKTGVIDSECAVLHLPTWPPGLLRTDGAENQYTNSNSTSNTRAPKPRGRSMSWIL